MSKTLTETLASMVGLVVLVSVAGAAQRAPNLSGDWVLVTATTSGGRTTEGGRAPAAGGEAHTMSNAVSGAGFNCGRECTIVHKGQTLTIAKALLGWDATPVPAVRLQLDGRQISVADPFTPNRQIPVTAKWNGDKLDITSSAGSYSVTQSVSITAGQLVVVTSVNRPAAQPVTFKYKKK